MVRAFGVRDRSLSGSEGKFLSNVGGRIECRRVWVSVVCVILTHRGRATPSRFPIRATTGLSVSPGLYKIVHLLWCKRSNIWIDATGFLYLYKVLVDSAIDRKIGIYFNRLLSE